MSRLAELAIEALLSESLITPDGNGWYKFVKSQPINVIDLTNVRTEVALRNCKVPDVCFGPGGVIHTDEHGYCMDCNQRVRRP